MRGAFDDTVEGPFLCLPRLRRLSHTKAVVKAGAADVDQTVGAQSIPASGDDTVAMLRWVVSVGVAVAVLFFWLERRLRRTTHSGIHQVVSGAEKAPTVTDGGGLLPGRERVRRRAEPPVPGRTSGSG